METEREEDYDNEEVFESDEEELDKEQREKRAFEDIRYDYKKAKEAKTIIDNLISDWNDAYNGKKLGNENPQKSKVVMKEIAKQIEWQKPALIEPFTSTSNPIRIKTGKDQNRSRIMQKYLNGQFAGEFDRRDFMNLMADVLLREGTVWTRTGWKFQEEKKVEFEKSLTMDEILQREDEPSSIKQNKDGTFRVKYDKVEMIRNIPTLEICRNEHIFPDPSARTPDELRFVIYEKFMTISEMRASGQFEEEKLRRLESKINAESREDTTLGQTRDADARDYGYDSTYQPLDKSRKKISVLEYWGYYDLDGDGIAEPIVAVWAKKERCNLYIGENPYPSKNIPFQRTVYSARTFSIWGNALAYFIEDNQRIKSGFMRGILDNMSLANNGQKFVQRGTLDYVNFKRLRNGERHIVVNKPDGIQDGTYNVIPQSVFQTMDMVDRDTKELVGNSGGGSQLSQKDHSEDNPSQLTMSQQRIAGTVADIANVLSKSLKEWLTMAEVFLTNEQIEGMFTEKDAIDFFAFKDARHVQTSVNVGTEVVRNMKIQQLNLLMQQSKTLGEKTPPDTMSELTAQMFDLFDMYDKSEEIRNYKPEPNPMAIEAQRLELEKQSLENEKLRAEIEEIRSNVSLNKVDAQSTLYYKDAQTQEKLAKAQSHQVGTALEPVRAMAEMQNSKKENNG